MALQRQKLTWIVSATSTQTSNPIVNQLSYSGSVTINNMTQLALDPSTAGKKMYFQLFWDDNNSGRTSYSRYFTVTSAAPGDKAFQDLASQADFQDVGTGAQPAHTEGTVSTQQTTTPASSMPTASTMSPSGGSGLTSPANEMTPGGLSNGAVAGIAVGAAVVGLIVVGGLLWFCLRRRRGDGVSTAPYSRGGNDRNRTQDLMAEKEAGATDVSPTSPYMDDPVVAARLDGSLASMPLHEPQQVRGFGSPSHEEIPAAAYQRHSRQIDHPHATQTAAVMASSSSDPLPSPAAAPSQYQHLVEEGMTEEEIRRMEEEERELDQAIEKAGKK
jgi:hypothetical protein